jgi:hypothetical protein
MERVSAYLEEQGEPVSLNAVEKNVKGKSRDWIRKAVEALVANGCVAETPGSRGARMLTSRQPFTSPDLAETSPGEVQNDLAHLAYPLQGGEVRGEVPGEDELERLAALGRAVGLT